MNWERFLSDKLSAKQYSYKPEAKKDILKTLKSYAELHPKEDSYVHNDGRVQNLLSLTGTIPVNFKGANYNIPIQIWLLQSHPFIVPVVFVRPTSAMVVKPSRHVDQAGRVYHPYLSQWSSPRSDTYGLIGMLQTVFSQESPVFAKPSIPPPRPMQPHAYPNQGPGYPIQGGMPMPGVPTSNYGGGYPTHQNYPSQNHHGMTSSYPQSPYPMPQTNIPYPTTNSYQQSTSTPMPSVSNLKPERQGSVIGAEHIHASLLSTAEDKLKRRVKEVFEMGKMELESLEQTKQELEKGNNELNNIMRKMDEEKANLNSNISLLTQKNDEMEDVLRKLDEDSSKVNVDEAVVTTAPLYNQILSLFAEENAVEDAIYYLSDALRREAIELDAYLKAVRSLSRKQFFLRATLQKARTTAGLSSSIVVR